MENSFILWAAEKKVKKSDLAFTAAIRSLHHQKIYQKLADHLANLHPSFSEGLATLELIAELVLMGYEEDLFFNHQSLESWKSHLRKLRYPMTAKQDVLLKNKLENLPWPQGAKIKFERRGDRAGLEFKFFVSSQVDITKLISALERVQAEMAK